MNNKLIEIVRSNLSEVFSDENITEDTDLLKESGFDSISLMQLVIDIEEAFQIEFDDDIDINEITNMKRLNDYVEKKINEK
jgi:acyl carrier protein